jgi:hypothetical protein
MKLHIYGDSFAEGNKKWDIENINYCWPEKVAENLGLKFINNAISGSSAEFSMYRFVNDIENENIDSDDIIIYVQTSFDRLYFNYFIHDNPRMSCYFLGVNKEEINSTPQYSYFRENYDHLVWYYNNIEEKINRLYHESFLHSIKNYAVNNPGVKILLLLLEPMSELAEMDHFGFFENLPKNLYFPNLSLRTISENEFTDTWDVQRWSKIAGYDPRVNHFSCPNLETLVNLTTNTFKEGSIENWSVDKFATKIFSRVDTLEKYLDYCDQKMLWCYSDIIQNYNKF